MRGGWGLRNLFRHPLRTALSLAGVAVAAAMLLDMVMLSGGIERSFAELLLSRGYQIRVTPAGTLPFDAEATIPAVSGLRDSLRADPAIAAAGAILGGSIYAHRGDSLLTLFAYGVEPEAQGIYQLEAGRDLQPGDAGGILLSRFAAAALHAGVGDTLRVSGRLDPQMADRLTVQHYGGGHMFYAWEASRLAFSAAIAAFVAGATSSS
jgi:putative ABC transport system permease protein